jgi:hypothetical protein
MKRSTPKRRSWLLWELLIQGAAAPCQICGPHLPYERVPQALPHHSSHITHISALHYNCRRLAGCPSLADLGCPLPTACAHYAPRRTGRKSLGCVFEGVAQPEEVAAARVAVSSLGVGQLALHCAGSPAFETLASGCMHIEAGCARPSALAAALLLMRRLPQLSELPPNGTPRWWRCPGGVKKAGPPRRSNPLSPLSR